MIQNKSSLIYSLNNSINNLEEIVKQSVNVNTPKHKEVYNSLGTALLWIGSCLDRLDEIHTIYTETEKKYVQAFKGAYNVQKHGVDLVGFTGFISGSCFPISFPMRFGDGNYYFKELDENIIKNKKQIVKYNEILKDKDIIDSVNIIKNIILDKMKCDNNEGDKI